MEKCKDCGRLKTFLGQLADGAAMHAEVAIRESREDAALVHAIYRDAARGFLKLLARIEVKNIRFEDGPAARRTCKTAYAHVERDELFHQSDCRCDHCDGLCDCAGGDLI